MAKNLGEKYLLPKPPSLPLAPSYNKSPRAHFHFYFLKVCHNQEACRTPSPASWVRIMKYYIAIGRKVRTIHYQMRSNPISTFFVMLVTFVLWASGYNSGKNYCKDLENIKWMSCAYVWQVLIARWKCRTGHFLQIFMGTMPQWIAYTLAGVRPAGWIHSGVLLEGFLSEDKAREVFRHLFPLQCQKFLFSTF